MSTAISRAPSSRPNSGVCRSGCASVSAQPGRNSAPSAWSRYQPKSSLTPAGWSGVRQALDPQSAARRLQPRHRPGRVPDRRADTRGDRYPDLRACLFRHGGSSSLDGCHSRILVGPMTGRAASLEAGTSSRRGSGRHAVTVVDHSPPVGRGQGSAYLRAESALRGVLLAGLLLLGDGTRAGGLPVWRTVLVLPAGGPWSRFNVELCRFVEG